MSKPSIKEIENQVITLLFEEGWNYDQPQYWQLYVDRISCQFKKMGWSLLGKGRNRIAFLSPSNQVVVKIPRSMKGDNDCLREGLLWQQFVKNPSSVSFVPAHCRLLPMSHCWIMMEYVNANYPKDRTPIWKDGIDCGQIGVNSRGQIVAYDFA